MDDKTPSEIARDIAAVLQGSSQSLLDALEKINRSELENNGDFCAVLDDLVFCCTTCDNWFEQSEMSEKSDWVCESCE